MRINSETTFWQMWILLKLYFKLFFEFFMAHLQMKTLFIQDFYKFRICYHLVEFINTLKSKKSCQRTKLSKHLQFIGLLDQIFVYSANFSGLYTVLMIGIQFFPLCFRIFLFFCGSFPYVSLEREKSCFFYAIIFLLLHNGCSLIHVANQMENHNIQNSKKFKYEEHDAQKAKN